MTDEELCSWLRNGINEHLKLNHEAANRIEELLTILDDIEVLSIEKYRSTPS